ncbi:uncharacterized protein Tco_0532067 [Tanacetum coccineum]
MTTTTIIWSMHQAEIWVTKGLLVKAKQNVLGLEIIRDQGGNTLRVSQSRIHNEKLVQTLLKGHSILSLEDSLSGDCDVEKNDKLLKQLFANEKDAKLLRWHSDERKKDGILRHVADSPQWRKINNKHDEFGGEIRNIRFGLSSDGINPFGNMSSKHSTWPVLLCVYNLPPWLCMKCKYIMMSLLIEGPKQPGNDIDVYLAPLIDDLKTLWDKGVKVYDAYKRETFTLRAMIFCTISDFPAYGNLSGYSTKGKFACPVCEDQTSSRWLPNCKKTVFTGHRRSLVRNHPYRKMKRELDGTTEYGRVPSSYPANIKKLVSVQDCKLVGKPNVDKTVERLGEGPRCVVRSYQGYDINGYTFYTEMQDENSTVQNSRVTLIASTMEFDRK